MCIRDRCLLCLFLKSVEEDYDVPVIKYEEDPCLLYTSNMSVITEDGNFYTFDVKYAVEPLLLNVEMCDFCLLYTSRCV